MSAAAETVRARVHVTEREYVEHEVAALFDAMRRGDAEDVRLTAVTLQQLLHIIALSHGETGATCARLTMDQHGHVLPDRERERSERGEVVVRSVVDAEANR